MKFATDNAQANQWFIQDVTSTPDLVNTFELCQDVITESNYPNIISDQSANIDISSFGYVAHNYAIIHQAGQSVTLMPDFEVDIGATYTVMIRTCQ